MKTCKNCGASINDDSRFCTQCGADTFEQEAQEETAVIAEASAQPATDSNVNSGEYYQPEAQAEAPAQSGEVYYQPVDGNAENSTASTYTYAVPTDQVPVGKGKKGKGRVWAIIAAVIVILGIVIRVGLGALGIFGEVADKLSSISEGFETSTSYVNSSIDLTIDTTKGGMKILSDYDQEYVFGIDPDDYETFIYDYDTDEYIYVMMAEGNLAEAAQNMKSFVADIAKSLYANQTNYEIGDVYERDIAGNTYTCVDISQTVNDPGYGTYYLEQTLCFIKSSTMFLEISITVYPEETGNHAQDIIDRYFVEMN